LDWLATARGATSLTLAGLLVSVASLVTNTSLGHISVLGPIVFGFLAWLAWRRHRRQVAVLAVLALLMSLTLTVRVYSTPGTAAFFYNGVNMDNSTTPYPDLVGVPLTTDPARGAVYTQIYPDVPDSDEFGVSCTSDGVLLDGKRSVELEWAQIISGKFQTLWVPMPFLAALAPGSAHTLLPCSNWRWELQRL
jgi:hypothetical protein